MSLSFVWQKVVSILYNYFRVNLLALFCKLDHFIKISNIYGIFIKRSRLQNRVSEFTPKKFYEIKQRCVSNNFIANNDKLEKVGRDFISNRTDRD
jgi:hypothetical protein